MTVVAMADLAACRLAVDSLASDALEASWEGFSSAVVIDALSPLE